MSRHPAVEELLQFFEFEHLRAGELRDASHMFHAMAHELADRLPAIPETCVARPGDRHSSPRGTGPPARRAAVARGCQTLGVA